MEFSVLSDRVQQAIDEFNIQDAYLLEVNANERCIAARLALYLQHRFDSYQVDVEYNRAGSDPKRLGMSEDCANSRDDDGTVLIVPDIIVHRRGPNGPNLLGIEVKKSTDRRGTDCD